MSSVVIENENEVVGGVVGGVVGDVGKVVVKGKKLQAKYERLYMSVFMVLDGVSDLDKSVKRSILEGIGFYTEDVSVQSMFWEEHILNSDAVKKMRKQMKEERVLWKRDNGLIPLKKRGGKKLDIMGEKVSTPKMKNTKKKSEIMEENMEEKVDTKVEEKVSTPKMKNPKKKSEKNTEKNTEKTEKKGGVKLLKGVIENIEEGVIEKIQIEVGKVKVVVEDIGGGFGGNSEGEKGGNMGEDIGGGFGGNCEGKGWIMHDKSEKIVYTKTTKKTGKKNKKISIESDY